MLLVFQTVGNEISAESVKMKLSHGRHGVVTKLEFRLGELLQNKIRDFLGHFFQEVDIIFHEIFNSVYMFLGNDQEVMFGLRKLITDDDQHVGGVQHALGILHRTQQSLAPMRFSHSLLVLLPFLGPSPVLSRHDEVEVIFIPQERQGAPYNDYN